MASKLSFSLREKDGPKGRMRDFQDLGFPGPFSVAGLRPIAQRRRGFRGRAKQRTTPWAL